MYCYLMAKLSEISSLQFFFIFTISYFLRWLNLIFIFLLYKYCKKQRVSIFHHRLLKNVTHTYRKDHGGNTHQDNNNNNNKVVNGTEIPYIHYLIWWINVQWALGFILTSVHCTVQYHKRVQESSSSSIYPESRSCNTVTPSGKIRAKGWQ